MSQLETLEEKINEAFVLICTNCDDSGIRYADTKYEAAFYFENLGWKINKDGNAICPNCGD